ncbi:hypothetical protein [Streptomyces sp. NPDC004546]|uniref:hypothetical protein n=1 Tax=Streptomyces sp. NPDC004546 TaxID=3154282 RepID=UPI0033AD55D9
MGDLLGYAAELGLDVHTFREDLHRHVHANRVQRDTISTTVIRGCRSRTSTT